MGSPLATARNRLALAATLSIGLSAGCVIAPIDPTVATPAEIGRDAKGLLNVIDCPLAKGKPRPDLPTQASVSCRVHLSAGGIANRARSGCFADTGAEQPFVVAVDEAVEKARFHPATIAGSNTPVVMHLRVIFRSPQAGVCDIAAIPNLGQQQDSFGAAYIAPQEIASGRTWLENQEHYGLPIELQRSAYRGGTRTMWVSVSVDTTGTASNARIERAENIQRGVQRMAINALSNSRFVPGRVGGEPTEMRYFDLMFRSRRHLIEINDDRD